MVRKVLLFYCRRMKLLIEHPVKYRFVRNVYFVRLLAVRIADVSNWVHPVCQPINEVIR